MIWARRFGIAIGCAVVLGIGALSWPRRSDASASPTYQGRTAEAWLHSYFRPASPAEFTTNYLALKSLRQESVPRLAEICVDSARPKTRWSKLAQELRRRIPWTARPETDSDEIYVLSEFALKTFDPAAREILPRAERVFRRSLGRGGKITALAMLRFSVGDPTPCVPLLVRALLDGDPRVGEAASEVALDLYQSKPPPPDLLQPVVQHLSRAGENNTSLDHSYRLLAEFGPVAANAAPLIRKRFEGETKVAQKANLGGVLIRIDPTATDVLNLLTDWTLGADEEKRSSGRFQLAMAGSAAAPVAERLWSALDSARAPHQLEDLLVRIIAPNPPVAGADPRANPLTRKLLDRAHQALSDPNRKEECLNFAWLILRLDPTDARAWEVFRGILMAESVSDSSEGHALWASTAMDYLLSIPIPTDERKRLLRETRAFYQGTTAFQRLLRETAQKHLIDLDPSERPSDVGDLIQLYLE